MPVPIDHAYRLCICLCPEALDSRISRRCAALWAPMPMPMPIDYAYVYSYRLCLQIMRMPMPRISGFPVAAPSYGPHACAYKLCTCLYYTYAYALDSRISRRSAALWTPMPMQEEHANAYKLWLQIMPMHIP